MTHEDPICPAHDLAVWDTYARKVPDSSRPIAEELFRRLCAEIQRRKLPWSAAIQGEVIGFKAPDENTYRVVIHVGQTTAARTNEFRSPSVLIHPYARLDDLGEPDPYPEFNPFWESQFSAQGWNVSSEWRVPDVAKAVELAVKYGRT
jgi:hypothetical protein